MAAATSLTERTPGLKSNEYKIGLCLGFWSIFHKFLSKANKTEIHRQKHCLSSQTIDYLAYVFDNTKQKR